MKKFILYLSSSLFLVLTICCYHPLKMHYLFKNHTPKQFAQKIDSILVIKSKRKMYLKHQDDIVKEYDIDLGGNPIGPKQKRGDNKTPEGIYKISYRNAQSKYFLSLRISYPNEKDIQYSKENNVDPGSDIMIHGLPNVIPGLSLPRDWTAGCIATRSNEDMLEIWDNIPINTPIEILP